MMWWLLNVHFYASFRKNTKLSQNHFIPLGIEIRGNMGISLGQALSSLSRHSKTDAIGIEILLFLILVSVSDESIPGGKFS